MQFNFERMQKKVGILFPEGKIRVTYSGISIASDLMKSFTFVDGVSRKEDHVYLDISIDKEQGAICLMPSGEGYSFAIRANTGTTTYNVPKKMASQLTPGDYVPFGADFPGVFVLENRVEELRSQLDAEAGATRPTNTIPDLKGKTVSWLVQPKGGKAKPFTAEGTVVKVWESVVTRQPQMIATVSVTSPAYHKLFPRRTTTTVKVDKLTVLQGEQN